jgi:hypothetical protein
LDVIDALANPFIPIHAAFHVELDASELHVYIFIVENWVPGEEVKVKRIDFELTLEGYKGEAEL